MKKDSSIFKILTLVVFSLLGTYSVSAADLSSRYTEASCDYNNKYWAIESGRPKLYNVDNVQPGVSGVPADLTLPNGRRGGARTNYFIYDIRDVRVQDGDYLYVAGWAMNVLDEANGSGQTAWQRLKFQLSSSSGTIPLTDIRAGGSINTTEFTCYRTPVNSWTVHDSESGSGFDWYKTRGECLTDTKNTGGTGFELYIDLKDPNLKEDTTYELQMWDDINGLWRKVSIPKNMAASLSSYKQRTSDGMGITISGGTDSLYINPNGTPLGTKGLPCGWGASKTAAQAIGTSFKGQGYTFKGTKTTVLGMDMYQVGVSENGGPGDILAYAPAIWTEFADEGVIKIELGKRKDIQPGDEDYSNSGVCEGKDTYDLYYLFVSTVTNDYNNVQTTSAQGTKFNDNMIFNSLDISSLNGMAIAGKGVYPIDAGNVNNFYTKLQSALKQPNKFIQEGNSFYITYDSWCNIDQATGQIKYCRDTETGTPFNVKQGLTVAPGGPWMKGGNFNIQEVIRATTVPDGDPGYSIVSKKGTTNEGFQFELQRNYVAHPEGRPAMVGGGVTVPVNSSDEESSQKVSYHPAAYKITFCKSENEGCEDDVSQGICPSGDEPAKAVFHENNDLKTCTIKKDNQSGFTSIDTEETTPPAGNAYCILSCKEDIDIDLPGHKETAAGQYFKLDNYVPKIMAKRTCVTAGPDGSGPVDYDRFDNDLKEYEERMPEEYNNWQDMLDIYLHFTGGSSHTSELPKVDSDPLYKEETKTCTAPCAAGDTACQNNPPKYEYKVVTYKINGNTFTYTDGLVECGVSASGVPYIEKYKEINRIDKFVNDSGEEITPKIEDLLNEERKKATQEKGKEETDKYKNKKGNSGEIGHVTKGTDTCTYECGTEENPKTCTATYSWQDWVIYPYDAINYASNNFGGDSDYWESTTPCSGEGETYESAVARWTAHYSSETSRTFEIYINDYNNYRETINTYNKCFNWNEQTDDAGTSGYSSHTKGNEPRIQKGVGDVYEDYYYKFKPKVTFDYEDDFGPGGMDKQVFPSPYTYDYDGTDTLTGRDEVVGTGFGKGSYPDTKIMYWNKGSTTDNFYSGGNTTDGGPHVKGKTHQEDRTVLDCNGTTCTESQTVDFKFYDSSYIKREEDVDYEYHLPRVYTKIPSGVVSTDNFSDSVEWLNLDDEAVPVNINTPSDTYDYSITVEEIINPEDIRAKNKNKENPNDNFDQRFAGATGNGAFEAGDQYICEYDVINDAYIPTPSRYNFFYRTIDPYNINPVPRTLGYNWNDARGSELQRRMAENEADYELLTSESNGKFTFTLTPTIMKQVREYNKTRSNSSNGGYADWDLACYDYDSPKGYHCYSALLSCMASGGSQNDGVGVSCNQIFGNSLNDYLTEYSTNYDFQDFQDNRAALIQKQTELDCHYGHAKEDAC